MIRYRLAPRHSRLYTCSMKIHWIKQQIQERYSELTPVERRIADYILTWNEEELPPARKIAAESYVSEAALTRFAKRCGYRGFREFGYSFYSSAKGQDDQETGAASAWVGAAYQTLIEKTLAVTEESQLEELVSQMRQSRRLLVCGIGSSGIAAREYRLRLLRLGFNVEGADESHLMRIMASLTNSDSMLMALSISGNTRETAGALKIAWERGAYTVLITAADKPLGGEYCRKILRIGSLTNLDSGMAVSPQIPLLVAFDLIYACLLREDYVRWTSIHSATLKALGKGKAEAKPDKDF